MAVKTEGDMKPAGLSVEREPCDLHALHPHDHSGVPLDLRIGRCSGRFWCGRCKRWLDGAKCKPVPVRKAA